MGLIHIYCGDGKGKTTAALGAALRAAGGGMKVHIIQLMKGRETSELNALNQVKNITIRRCDKDYGFTFNMSSESRKKLIECHNNLLIQAETLLKSDSVDMLIIDEFNAAYEYELLNRELADRIVLKKPDKPELILTGRNPNQKFLNIAHYVSEITSVKHPYSLGINARKGIEY